MSPATRPGIIGRVLRETSQRGAAPQVLAIWIRRIDMEGHRDAGHFDHIAILQLLLHGHPAYRKAIPFKLDQLGP